MPTQREKAEALRRLHEPGSPLVLINAWDAVSARIIEDLGFPAIATTSAGIAWAEGFADGERISRDRMLQAVSRVTQVVAVPVTADLEAGYGQSTEDAVATARGAIVAGAVGLNFEDWDDEHDALTVLDAQAARIAAIRKTGEEAGVPLVINARTDVFLQGIGENDAWRVEEAIERGKRYSHAGADCIFVPGVTDERTIATIVGGIGGPINVLAGPATPSLPRLAELGVARVSVGASAMASAVTQLRNLAQNVQKTGTFGFTADRLSHAQLNALFEPT
jgi:2-methylisocitrate lyase-like PEP mutase family enzyme